MIALIVQSDPANPSSLKCYNKNVTTVHQTTGIILEQLLSVFSRRRVFRTLYIYQPYLA